MATGSSSRPPAGSHDASWIRESSTIGRFLYRPIVFNEPDRIVGPPSWLEHVPFAFWIVDALRPAVFVELGTQSGNSYASFAQAVQALGLPTACYAVDTWKGDSQAGFYGEDVFAEWVEYHDRHFAAFSRLIRSTFEEAAHHFPDGGIDLLHIDGCHTYEAVSADFERWRPKLSRRGVMLLHDINVRERDFGTWRLWDELKARYPSFEFLHGQGLGVVATGPEVPEPLQWLFSTASNDSAGVNAVRQFFARLGSAVSARFAAAGIDGGAGPENAGKSGQISGLESRLAAEEEAHDLALRDRWRMIAELQERIRAESERRRQVETQHAEQHVTLTRLTETEIRIVADLTEATRRVGHLERQLADERSAHEEWLGRKTRIAVALQERIRGESAQRRQLEEERDRLLAGRSARLSASLQNGIKRIDATGRRLVRSLWTIARMPKALGVLPTRTRRMSRSILRIVTHPARLREAYAVAASGLFDETYYRTAYPDVVASRLNPLAHFVLQGAREGRKPHPLFDAAYYLRCNPEVTAAGVNPLVHYWQHGAFEGRNPHPLFDVAYYLESNPDVRNAGVEPLKHFLAFGAADGRNPNPFFDCSHYLRLYPDVGRHNINPLVHFALYGWREGRRPSAAFDTAYYLSQHEDVRLQGGNPLVHYVEHGRFEDRPTTADGGLPALVDGIPAEPPPVRLKARSLGPAPMERPTVLCLSHVWPWPPRAGNEYRIYRILRWLRDQGYRVVPVIAPLPGDRADTDAVHALAGEFSNAVLCGRDGRLEYVLRDVPDVLASLGDEFTRPVATMRDEEAVRGMHPLQLLQWDRTFCHDALVTTALRLHQVLGPYVLLAEYVWMSRVLPLMTGDVLKVIDTIDVFSTKRQKVLQFGIDDLHVDPAEEAKRLRRADLILAIQDDERKELEQLVPGKRVVTAGVDFDVVKDGGVPSGRRALCVASDNPMNRKGLADFLRFAWPHIRREVPDAELLVAGKVSGTLDADVPGVIRLGPIEDLGPLYSQARVVINPAVAGTGLKIKTLEALGHLRPIVTWPNGIDGLGPDLAAFCVTVQDWYEYSRRVAGVLAACEPLLFSEAERDTIVRLTSPETVYRDMTDAIESLADQRFGRERAGSGVRVRASVGADEHAALD